MKKKLKENCPPIVLFFNKCSSEKTQEARKINYYFIKQTTTKQWRNYICWLEWTVIVKLCYSVLSNLASPIVNQAMVVTGNQW